MVRDEERGVWDVGSFRVAYHCDAMDDYFIVRVWQSELDQHATISGLGASARLSVTHFLGTHSAD